MMRVQSKSKSNQLPENLRSMLLVFSSLVIFSGFLYDFRLTLVQFRS